MGEESKDEKLVAGGVVYDSRLIEALKDLFHWIISTGGRIYYEIETETTTIYGHSALPASSKLTVKTTDKCAGCIEDAILMMCLPEMYVKPVMDFIATHPRYRNALIADEFGKVKRKLMSKFEFEIIRAVTEKIDGCTFTAKTSDGRTIEVLAAEVSAHPTDSSSESNESSVNVPRPSGIPVLPARIPMAIPAQNVSTRGAERGVKGNVSRVTTTTTSSKPTKKPVHKKPSFLTGLITSILGAVLTLTKSTNHVNPHVSYAVLLIGLIHAVVAYVENYMEKTSE